jgi:SAM-dependent methyltransferase
VPSAFVGHHEAVKADRIRWETRYRAGDRPHDGPPSTLLRRWLARASRAGEGRALDVATGLGRNALCLARAGYQVDAVDISPTALREAARRARRAGLRGIRWIAADLDRWRPPRGRYDLILVAFFLERRLFRPLRAAVRPGGLLIVETHLDAGEPDGGPPRKWRLRPGELRRVLGDWKVLYARDGRCRVGRRLVPLGRIVVRRPTPARRRRTAGRSGSSRASSR